MRLALAIAGRLGQIWKPYVFAALAAGTAAVLVAALGAIVGQWVVPYSPSTDQPSQPIFLISHDLVALILGAVGLVIAAVAIAKTEIAETTLRAIGKALRRRDYDC